MFGDADALIQIDMSEYMEKHNVSRLIGAPPGYVGYEEGGQLTEKIRRRPYAVVLLDEIEKAHPDVFNMLLQVMEEGRLTDSFGRNVDFRNAILIMTTNAGAEAIKNESAFGFQKRRRRCVVRQHEGARDGADRAASSGPSSSTACDDVIVFRHLTTDDLKQRHRPGTDARSANGCSERGLKLILTDEAKEFIIKKGSNTDFGARPLRRAIENFVEDPLSEELLKGEFQGKDTIIVDAIKDDEDKPRRLDFKGLVTNHAAAALQEPVAAAGETK